MIEEWKPIVRYDGWYEISNFGRIASWKRKYRKILVTAPNIYGYICAQIKHNQKSILPKIHHLVLEEFVCPRPEGLLGCHIDGNKSNCRLDNLYWGTPQENSNDRIRHGRSGKEEENSSHKLKNWQVVELRKLYEQGGYNYASLARIYGVSDVQIGRIIKRENRKTI